MIKRCAICDEPFEARRNQKTCSSECRTARRRLTNGARRLKNPEKHREYSRRYRLENPEKQREYRLKNPEKQREYRLKNPEKQREHTRKSNLKRAAFIVFAREILKQTGVQL